MSELTHDEQTCLERLEAFERSINEILDMQPSSGLLPLAQERLAKARYRDLKHDLRAEHKRWDSSHERAKLTDAEQRFYSPHVSQTYVDLREPVNARTDSEWFSNLYNARITIRHAIAELRSRMGEK